MMLVNRKELRKALPILKAATSRLKTMPILQCVRIQSVGRGGLVLVATDLEVAARVTLKGHGDGTAIASVCIPAKALCAAIPGGKAATMVHLETLPDNQLKVDGVTLQGQAADEFPTPPEVGNTDRCEGFPAAEMRDVLSRVSYAASRDETRYNLNGVLAEPLNGASLGGLRFVATDGHRLAMARPEIACAFPFRLDAEGKGVDTIIPLAAVTLLVRAIGKRCAWGDEVVFRQQGDFLAARMGSLTVGGLLEITGRLIDGTFPNYRQVLPKPNGRSVTVDRDEMVAAIEALKPVMPEGTRAVKLTLSRDWGVRVFASNPDAGEGERDVAAEVNAIQDGESIAFNANYLIDALEASPTDRVVLHVTDTLSAVWFGQDAIVMPMRL